MARRRAHLVSAEEIVVLHALKKIAVIAHPRGVRSPQAINAMAEVSGIDLRGNADGEARAPETVAEEYGQLFEFALPAVRSWCEG